ncbi:MAG: ATP-grasp domain-containing protein [Bacteroidota bacterium]
MPFSTSFPVSDQPAVYVIHENEEWVIPLRTAFDELGIPYNEWFVNEGSVGLSGTPPEGVFYNRMSASSHTRSHRFAVELTEPLLAWLQSHNRVVINGRRAIQLEVRKFEQYLALQQAGISTPKTTAASGKEAIIDAARYLGQTPFIVKPNRGGKGLGVQLLQTVEELEDRIDELSGSAFSLDGITLVQEYIKPANDRITRMEFIDGTFYYAVEVDASDGFELCPADSCAVEDQFCPAPATVTNDDSSTATAATKQKKFKILPDFNDHELMKSLENFFEANVIQIAAAEFVEDTDGKRYVYDLNMNTNYNQEAERDAGNRQRAMHQVAEYLGGLLNTR